MNMPPDDNDPYGQYPDPHAQFAPPDMGGGDLELNKKKSKTPLIVVGGVVAAGLGYFLWHSAQQQKEREQHAEVMKQFADIEKDYVVGKFWACLFGPNVDPGTFQNNMALSGRMEGAFASDPKNYPAKVREECTPKAKDARQKIEALNAPPDFAPAFKAYGDSLTALGKAFDAWSQVAPTHLADREVGRKVGEVGGAWHAFEGAKPTPEVIAYDRFLHCAVPTIDKLKDGQALVELLFKQCKDAQYVDKLQETCGKEATAQGVPAAPTKTWKATLKKFAADDRELSAFDDCLRKGRKMKRSDDTEEAGRAWKSYVDAGAKVREAGKAALATEK